MVTAIDTNIIVTLWQGNSTSAQEVQNSLDIATKNGSLTISGAVFAELIAAPKANEQFVYDFCFDAGIIIDWSVSEAVWLSAGVAYKKYAKARSRNKNGAPRRILADFLIGAHANENGHSLLTLDGGIFRSAFPELNLLSI